MIPSKRGDCQLWANESAICDVICLFFYVDFTKGVQYWMPQNALRGIVR